MGGGDFGGEGYLITQIILEVNRPLEIKDVKNRIRFTRQENKSSKLLCTDYDSIIKSEFLFKPC